LGDAVADLGLPHLPMLLVREQDHHEVAAAGGVDDRDDLEALLARLGDRLRVLAQADDDVDAGVFEVERVGVALRAVADDGDGLAVEEPEVSVVVVDHARRVSEALARDATATDSRMRRVAWPAAARRQASA